MKEIKLSVNMEAWKIGHSDIVRSMEIPKEQFHLIDKGYITKGDQVEIFGAAVVWGYGLFGYEFYEENGKYYTRYRQGDTCD